MGACSEGTKGQSAVKLTALRMVSELANRAKMVVFDLWRGVVGVRGRRECGETESGRYVIAVMQRPSDTAAARVFIPATRTSMSFENAVCPCNQLQRFCEISACKDKIARTVTARKKGSATGNGVQLTQSRCSRGLKFRYNRDTLHKMKRHNAMNYVAFK